jgi:hypothetical protein
VKPLAIDFFCGLGGWTEGLLAEGYDVIGFDIEQHIYGEHHYPAQLVLQDVLMLHGRQFKDAALIVASPPCQDYSYMAMPWKRAKAMAAAIEADKTGEALRKLNERFDACIRIQREASEAAGCHVPMVIENVCGAQRWVGRARWHYGSYYLWGDVPALMPIVRKHAKVDGLDWSKFGQPDYKTSGAAGCFRDSAIKNAGGSWFGVAHNTTSGKGRNPDGRDGHAHCAMRIDPRDRMISDGTKHGGTWFHDRDSPSRRSSSKSPKRKMASAMIAKIPFPLSSYIARVYRPAVTSTGNPK